MRFEHLQDWLDWQETLHSQKIELGLDRIAEVADGLGISKPNYKVIVVAGTNGKGSIVAILESIYHQSGYRVGSYTSPHLIRYNERIRIDKQNVDDKKLCDAFDLVDQHRGETSLSYFEFGTLAAMQIFNSTKLDVAIYEVGLGGRLDAVNILDSDTAIISNIGIDHVQWLGSTRESIGFEKAGIYRSGIPAVCGDTEPPESVIKFAKEIDAELFLIDKDYSYYKTDNNTWSFSTKNLIWENLPIPSLFGDAQMSNAATALMSVVCMDHALPVTRDSIELGLNNIALLGRFQRIKGSCEVILDVAHNLDSAKVLADNLKNLAPVTKTLAVFAILADKDVDGIINAVQGIFDEWFISNLHSERALSSIDLLNELNEYTDESTVHQYSSISDAYKAAKKVANDSTRIVVFGSFLTVAEVLSLEV